jgi:hypothetical protein
VAGGGDTSDPPASLPASLTGRIATVTSDGAGSASNSISSRSVSASRGSRTDGRAPRSVPAGRKSATTRDGSRGSSGVAWLGRVDSPGGVDSLGGRAAGSLEPGLVFAARDGVEGVNGADGLDGDAEVGDAFVPGSSRDARRMKIPRPAASSSAAAAGHATVHRQDDAADVESDGRDIDDAFAVAVDPAVDPAVDVTVDADVDAAAPLPRS